MYIQQIVQEHCANLIGGIDSSGLKIVSTILGITELKTTENFRQFMQNEYNEIVKSVYDNKGFYIGRYETTGMLDSSSVKVVAGSKVGIDDINWSQAYAVQKKYSTNKGLTSVKSTMIQGAAYDQVMKFIENGKRPDGKTYTIKDRGNVGSRYDGDFDIFPYETGGRDYATNYEGTVPYNDCVKNIYDLEGNITPWTAEGVDFGYHSDSRVYRGINSASGRDSTTGSGNYHGSIMQLYVISNSST